MHDRDYMDLCLRLARRGAGRVSPNPMVGAVLVKGGEVIGRGYHRAFGGPHAEVHAIRSARGPLHGATLYVNLEPCSHFGKTPPCTGLIASSGIREVVVGIKDPNPAVNGRGIAALRRAGIRVRTGILRDECLRLNEAFVRFITTGKPFVTLKIAQTLDGNIADIRGTSHWITGEKSRALVHRLRAETDAVLVGAGTVRKDNPRLTVRGVRGRNPLRIILDGRMSAPRRSRVFKPGAKTFLYVSDRLARASVSGYGPTVSVIPFPAGRGHSISIPWLLDHLGRSGIASVLVEGGAGIFGAFLKARAADKVVVMIAPKLLGTGVRAISGGLQRRLKDALRLKAGSVAVLGGDLVIEGYLH